jgi:uncharacterized repeat protein (TIGR01451 family)
VTLPPAGTITVTFQVSVAGTASGTIANVATVSTPPGTTDTTPGNNTGTATITVGLVADLGISKTASTATPSAGGTLTFSLVITNAGPSTATSATFADTLPTGLGTIAQRGQRHGRRGDHGQLQHWHQHPQRHGDASPGWHHHGDLPGQRGGHGQRHDSQRGDGEHTAGHDRHHAGQQHRHGHHHRGAGGGPGHQQDGQHSHAERGRDTDLQPGDHQRGAEHGHQRDICGHPAHGAGHHRQRGQRHGRRGDIANVVSATGGGATTGSFNIGTSTLSGTVTLPPAGTITVTFQVSVAGTASGTIANVATVSTPPGTTDTTPGNNTGTATITVGLVADLGISKTASTATPSAGGTLTFSLVITNAGPSTATSATFADTLPTGLGTIANVVSATGGGATTGSFNIGTSTLSGTVTLPPAGTITVTFQVSVAGTASGTIANVATVSTPPGTTDTTPGNNTGTATITVGLVADLGISKTASTATPSAGGTLTFSLVITNAGPSTATSATFADTLPTGLGTIANVVSATGGGATTGSFNIGTSTLSGTVTLPPAGTITVTFQVSVAGTASGTIANVATVSTPPGTTDTTPGNNTGTATITVGLVADLGISKTASTATPSAGGTLTFSLVITNAGPSTATSATFADTLPTGLGTIANVVSATGGGATTGSFNIGTSTLSGTVTLPPAGTITVTFQVSVAGTASGTIANVATVSTPPGTTDTTPGNNTGTATITVGLVADLGISKTASTATPSAGGTLTFSLVITNAGPSTATSATFADTLPTGLGTIANVVSATGGGATTGSFNIGTSTLSGTVTLPPAGTITVTFQVSVAGTASGTIANVATVSTPPGTTDTTPGNNTGTATITVGLVADLGISKTASTATPSAGGTLTFSLVITNAGPSTATSATFADTLPTGLGTIANVVSATGGGATTGSFNIGTSTLSGTVTLPPAGTITVTFQVSVAGTASGTIANVATVSTPPGTTDTTPGNNTGTATITVGLVADLGISKTASTATPSAGGTLTFSLVITNAGPSTATSATFADTLPTGLGTIANVVSATGGGATTGSFNIGTSTLSGTVTLPPAGTITVTFQVSVAGTASGTIANVATVSTPPGTTDTTPGNNTGTATITVGLVADLGISKTASTATPSAGGTLTFSLVITNAGPSTATSATFADTLPTGLGTIANVVSATGGGATTGSFNIGTSTLSGTVTLPPAGTITVTFQVSVAGTASGTIANVATVSTPPGTTDTTPGNNTGTATITVGLVADLGISKTASTATPSAGGTLTFSLVITNAGPSTATSATFADTLPTGLGTIANVVSATGGGATTGSFNIGTSTLSGTVTLPPAGTITVTFQVSVAGTASGTIANVATVSTPPGTTDTTPGNNTGTATITVGLVADLGISKTASTATPSAGGTLTFSLVITNAGPSTATSATFADTLPTGLGTIANVVSATGGGATTGSFNIGTSTLSGTVTLPPAGTITVTFQVSVAGTASGTIANVATVSTPPGTTDTTPGNNTGTATITVGLVADLGISKTASTATPSAGGTLTFSLVITNAGPSTATSATFADTLPTGLGTIANVVSATGGGATTGSFNIGTSTLSGTVTLPPAGTITVTFQVSVAGTASGTIANVATVSTPPGTTDTTPGNNTGTATITVGLVADLGISKTASTATPSAGGTLTFSLVITNAGPSTATSATFADTLPTGLGTIANVVSATGGGATTGSFNIGTSTLSGTVTLPPAGTITVTFQVSVAGTASGTIANVATVSTPPGTTDTTPGNNTGTATITVGLVADLGISKTASTATPSAGGTLTFSLVITNAGPSTATSATFADTLPTGLGTIANVVSATGGGATTGSFNIGTSTLSGTVTLPPAGTITVTFQVSVAGTASGTIANVATVSTPPGTTDTTPGNNTGTATITVGLVADVTVTKVASAVNATAGQTIGYTVTVVNLGPSVAQNVTATDVLGTGLSLVSASGNNGTVSVAGASVGATTSSLAAGQTLTLVVVAQVAPSVTSGFTLTNAASATSTTPDPTPTNTITKTLTVITSADVTLTKVASVANATPGQTISYTVTLVNLGPSVAQNVTISDILSAGLSRISSSSNNGTPTQVGTSTTVVGSASLAVGQTLTLIVNATVTAATGNITNTAVGTSTTPDPTPTNTVTVPTPVANVADVTVTKVASAVNATAGQTIGYTVTVVNLGPSVAQNVTATDVLGTGLSLVSASGNNGTVSVAGASVGATTSSLAAGQTLTLVVVAQVAPSVTSGFTLTNAASATSTTPDPTPTNTITKTLTVITSADVTLTKVASVANATPGQTISYTVTLVNLGPSVAQNVTISDILSAGLSRISSSSNNGTPTQVGTSTTVVGSASLAVGQTLTLIVNATVTAATGNITNTAVGTSTTPDPTPTNTVTVPTPVANVADVTVTKVASAVNATAGQTIGYTVTVVNLGPSVAQNVTATDVLGTGLSLVSASGNNGTVSVAGASVGATTSSLAAGQTLTLVVVAQVAPSVTSGFTLTNAASATSTTPDPTPTNTITKTLTVITSADVTLTKVASVANATPGQTISYTVTLVNLGPSVAQNVTISDILSAGLSRISSSSNNGTPTQVGTSTTVVGSASLAVGQTLTLIVNATVTAATGNITNTAVGTSTTPDPTPTNTVTVPTPVANVADVTVTKVASAVNATAGQTIGYTVTVVNLGPSVAQNVTATDVLGTGLSLVSASGNNGTVSVAGASVGATTSSLAAGQTLTLVVVAQVAPSVTSGFTLTNAASATSTTPDPTPTNTITKTLTVITSADVTLTKVASVANATPGQTISYTVTLVNLGPSVAQNVTISDILSAGLSRISSSSNNGTPTQVGTSTTVVGSASLAVGQTLTLIVNATVTAATGNITNTAVGTSTTPDPTPTNTVTVPTPVANVADVTVTKVASAVNATAGQTIGYTVTVVNLGPSVAQNVTATDVLGTGLSLVSASGNNGTVSVAGASVGATTSSLAAGQTLTLVVVAQVAPSVTSGFTLTNAASATSTTPDPTPTNTITKTLTVITSADVTLTKVASVANATPGQTISYTVTLVNLGPSVAQNVTISDILSAGLSRISSSSNNGTPTQVGTSTTVVGSASLAVGQTLTLIVNATVTAATGNITNTAVGTSTTPDPTPTNTVTVPTPVANVADVTVTKVASAVNATAGQTIGYTVTVVNLGPSVAQNVTATDVLGTGLSLVSASGNNGTVSVAGASVGATTSSLAAGQTLTLVVVAQVAPSVTSGFTLTNAASATSTTPDPTPTNTITKTLTVITSADVTLTKVASVANATPGQTISYTVTLVNLGPSVAQNVTISDILSAGLSRISSSSNNGTPTQVGTSTTVVGSASLAVGQTLTLIVNATVTAATGNITNTAVGTSTTPDPTPTNTVTVPTPVANVADVTVTKVASAVNATAGQTIGYTVTVVNLGPSVAQNVTATDVLGTGLSLVSASGNNGTVSVAGASVGATTSSLAAGQTLTLVVVAQVAPSVTSGFTLTNAASATSTTPDPTPTNTITKTLTVITSADVTLTKVASVANATPGQTISYTVTLVNLGPSVAQNVTISDILSAGLSRISSSSNNGTPTQVGTSTTVVGSASLAVGQTLTLIVNATVTAATGNITNTAVGTSTTPDPTPTNTVTVVVPMNAVADVSTTLSVSGQGTPGATVTATVTFTNNGPSPAQNVTATIVLPSGTVTLVPIGTLPAGSNTITVVSYPVPAGTLTTQSWTAGVATTTPESTTANNTVTRVLGPTQADVSVTLSMPTSASPGTVVSGTVVFHNIGPVQADNVTRTLVIQSATLTAVTGATIQSGGKTATFPSVSLPPSSSVVFTFTYAIPQSGGVNATATVATTTPELSTANNIASALTAVGGIADLSVSLVVNPETGRLSSLLVAGENNSLQVVVTNLGTAARGGTATLILPPFFAPSYTYPLRTGNDARCAGGNTCTFVLTGPLSPGQTTGFTVSYYVVPNNPTATFVTDGTAAQTFTAVVRADGPESRLDNNDTGQLLIPIGANLSGTSCIDSQKNGRCNDAGDVVLPNVLVKLFRGNTATLVATRITDSNGRYEFKGLEAGSNYMIMFLSCTDPRNEATCTTVNTTPRNNGQTTVRFGEANRATVQVEPGRTTPSGGTVGAVLQNVVLVAGDSTINQELPLDPSGSFYDSSTRQRIASAITLRLCGPAAFSSIHLVSPAGASVRNVGGQQCVDSDFVGGFYSYLFNGDPGNRPPDGEYTLAILAAPGYQVAVATGGGVSAPGSIGATPLLPFAPVAGRPIPPDGIVFMQQDHPDPITVGGVRYSVPQTRNQIGEYGTVTPANAGSGTQYALRLAFNFSACGGGGAGICFNQLFNNNIPLDAIAAPVVLNADVSMLKSGPVEMVAGGTGTYTLAVGNGGPGSAANVVVTDNLPAGLTLLSATVQPAGALALSVTPSGVSATTNSFAAGAAATLTLVVRAEVSAVGTTVTNVASIASSTTDTNPANNTSSVATRIIGADMSMVKTGPASLAAGGTAVYVLTVINAGPSAAANVTVTDALPAGLTLLSASASSGNFTLMTTSSSLTALALAMPVGTTNIVLTVALDDLLVGTVTNVARVSNTIGDPNPSNNSGTATSAVLGADLSITKLGPPSISAAGTATYTLVIVNNGPSSAGNVTVTDVIPVGLSLLSTVASGATLTVVSTPDKMVANAPLLRAGSTATLVLTVQAAYTATGTVTNIANITSTTPDPTATNNIGSATSSIRDVEPGVILVNKTGNKTVAELGDSVQYTIRMRNTIGLPVNRVTLEDLLPAGFRYILGTARLNGVALADPAGGVGRQLVFDVGNIPPFTTYELTYYVRLGVGSQQGDGVNRATAVFPGARGLAIRSNTALFKVNVQGGVFSNEGCIVGKVFLDCDGNRVQNLNKDGTVELGIPGVRLVMLDGSYVVTDSEGKYSLCGVKPQTHVIKVDRTTLPAGSRLLPSSNRNAAVGSSLIVDMKGGELARADFIEGSCSVEVLEQVKARRAQGGVAVPETRAQPQAGGVK